MRLLPSLVSGSRYRAGDKVTVKSADEILATLDDKGCIDGLPFQPEMLRYCGQTFDVFRSAHKTCDYSTGGADGRRMVKSVHLDGVRCDGAAHDGCEAHCYLFWRDEWLRPAGVPPAPGGAIPQAKVDATALQRLTRHAGAATPADTVYICQTTELPRSTTLLAWWDLRQYVDDWTSRNLKLGELVWLLAGGALRSLMGLGVGYRFFKGLHDRLQAARGRPPYRDYVGPIPVGAPTPTGRLGLEVGESVRVREWPEIEATLNQRARNRGMKFDYEMVKFCGRQYKVEARVDRIIDEKSSKMVTMKEPCIQLDGVHCMAECTADRLGCPRRGRIFWREIWLERARN